MIDIVELLPQGLILALLVGISTVSPQRRRLRIDASLCDAASIGDRRQIRSQLTRGIDPNSADEDGTTALMAAVFAGQLEVARDLLKAGADPDAQDVSGMTALMNGVIANGELVVGETHPIFQRIVQLLLDHGADIDLEDADGLTAVDHARSLGLDDLVEQLGGQEAGRF